MIITCPECQTSFALPDDKFKPGRKARCSKCAQVFVMQAPEAVQAAQPAEQASSQQPVQQPQRPVVQGTGNHEHVVPAQSQRPVDSHVQVPQQQESRPQSVYVQQLQYAQTEEAEQPSQTEYNQQVAQPEQQYVQQNMYQQHEIEAQQNAYEQQYGHQDPYAPHGTYGHQYVAQDEFAHPSHQYAQQGDYSQQDVYEQQYAQQQYAQQQYAQPAVQDEGYAQSADTSFEQPANAPGLQLGALGSFKPEAAMADVDQSQNMNLSALGGASGAFGGMNPDGIAAAKQKRKNLPFLIVMVLVLISACYGGYLVYKSLQPPPLVGDNTTPSTGDADTDTETPVSVATPLPGTMELLTVTFDQPTAETLQPYDPVISRTVAVASSSTETKQEATQIAQNATVTPSAQVDNVLPPEENPAAVKIALEDIRESLIENSKIGNLVVIEGYAKNAFETPRDFIAVEGRLLDNKGRILATSGKVYCGVTLTLLQLQTLGERELAKVLDTRAEVFSKNVNVAPGARVPFVLVFKGMPEDYVTFEVLAVDSTPSKQQNQVGGLSPVPAGNATQAAPSKK